jgi:hypothetical protein
MPLPVRKKGLASSRTRYAAIYRIICPFIPAHYFYSKAFLDHSEALDEQLSDLLCLDGHFRQVLEVVNHGKVQ